LAIRPRALHRGSWVVDHTHWDGLPNRADTQPLPPCAGDCELRPAPELEPGQLELPGITSWMKLPAARVLVAHRTLATMTRRRPGMSELVATRIREHAERLHLANLTGNFDALLTLAEQAPWAIWTFSTCCSKKRSACAKAAASTTP
jgi:hypothetical protein